MKKLYEKIELEIIELSTEDVIRTSLGGVAGSGGQIPGTFPPPFIGGGDDGDIGV